MSCAAVHFMTRTRLRCASRDYYAPTLRDNITGLRCVVWPLEAPGGQLIPEPKAPFLENEVRAHCAIFPRGPAPVDQSRWRLDVMGLVAHPPRSIWLRFPPRYPPTSFSSHRRTVFKTWTIKRPGSAF